MSFERRLRILHAITVSEAGGAQSVVIELARHAAAEGHDVAVASDPGGSMWDALGPDIVRFPIASLKKSLDPAKDAAAYLEFRRVRRLFKPDIVHLHSSKAGALGRILAGRFGPRTVYTVHGFDSIATVHRAFLPLERALQRSCGAIVAVSEYDRGRLESEGIKRNIYMIPNGARDYLGIEAPAGPELDVMRKTKAEGRFVVLSIARMAKPKRFDLFARAAADLENEGASFFWIGNKDAVDQKAIPSNLAMLGDLPSAGAYIAECDAFVLLSDFEGLPMSVLEAMSCCKPIVASAVGGISEELAEGSGVLTENEPTAVADSLRRLMLNRGSAERLGAAARRRFAERFSADRMAEAYSALYSEIADRAGRK